MDRSFVIWFSCTILFLSIAAPNFISKERDQRATANDLDSHEDASRHRINEEAPFEKIEQLLIDSNDSVAELLDYDSIEDLRDAVDSGEFDDQLDGIEIDDKLINEFAKLRVESRQNEANLAQSAIEFGESIYAQKWAPLTAGFGLSGAQRSEFQEFVVMHEARVDELYQQLSLGILAVDEAYAAIDVERGLLAETLASMLTADELGQLSTLLSVHSERIRKAQEDYTSSRINQGLTGLMVAAMQADSGATLEALVAAGAQVNAVDRANGTTALMKASASGNYANVTTLINLGADVDARDSSGSTALFSAVSGGHFDVVQVLIDHGADLNLSNTMGFTAFERAALLRYTSPGHSEIATLLEKLQSNR